MFFGGESTEVCTANKECYQLKKVCDGQDKVQLLRRLHAQRRLIIDGTNIKEEYNTID